MNGIGLLVIFLLTVVVLLLGAWLAVRCEQWRDSLPKVPALVTDEELDRKANEPWN